MLKKTVTAAAIALGAAVIVAAPANAATRGYATDRLEVKAGPDYDYPTVTYVRSGSPLSINGCLRDWSWCDVSTPRGRGWVVGDDIQAEREGRRIAFGSPWGVPQVTFSVGTYWDSYYKNRSFYSQRGDWDRRWNNYGPRRDWWRDHDGRDWDGDGRDRDRPR